MITTLSGQPRVTSTEAIWGSRAIRASAASTSTRSSGVPRSMPAASRTCSAGRMRSPSTCSERTTSSGPGEQQPDRPRPGRARARPSWTVRCRRRATGAPAAAWSGRGVTEAALGGAAAVPTGGTGRCGHGWSCRRGSPVAGPPARRRPASAPRGARRAPRGRPSRRRRRPWSAPGRRGAPARRAPGRSPTTTARSAPGPAAAGRRRRPSRR